MKHYSSIIIILVLTAFSFQSCTDNDDIATPQNLEINDFIWKGLNVYYLWQDQVPNLADNRFATHDDYNMFLANYTPESLFDALRVDKSIDRFSWIVSDYTVLEQGFQGTTKSNGIEFKLGLDPNDKTKVVGVVTYIIPNSDASTKSIARGAIFNGIDGKMLSIYNYKDLLFSSSENYNINFANFDGSTITSNGKSVAFTKTVLDENPILINKVFNLGSNKIGYLMYNGFYSSYDLQLNNAFGSLKANGITDLVLDLRYNPGGSVLSATRLASMITGQFTNQVFSKLTYNSKKSASNSTYLFPDKIGTTPINSLNLSKIYILTSSSTASASELIINGLQPYITVIQIGDTTVGKNQASRTLYDSADFSSNNRNPNHKYAMQPIVAYTVNKNDFGNYQSGIVPNFILRETASTYGVLGDSAEPLLNTAIAKITGTARTAKPSTQKPFQALSDSKTLTNRGGMQIE
ncbi:S41 family peptidase [Flavobacterium sp. 7A]|uniref:S41 family peptidase n=1 Tax=Flavobacterium sp. 7A TaxID=2940571 RepID=UPI0022267176|nr:S41 family peptidase [Flavobacterium sp. 7A]MCW2119587.1 C-terminal processing protease CtpA/Prc [Flavobacterium sp. 7A]